MTDCRHSGTRSSSASLSGVISKHVGSSLSGLATGVLPYGTHTPLKPNAPARYLNSSHPGIISPTTLVSGYTNSIATFNSSHNTHRGSGTEPIPIATHSKEPVAIPYATALITITFTLHQPSSTLIYPPAVASSISRVAYSVGFSAAKSAAFLAMSLVNSSASATHAAVISTTTTVPSLLKNYTIDAPSAVAPTVLHAGSTSGLSAVQSDSSVAIPSMVANESLVRQTTDGPTQTFVPTSKVVSRVSEGMVQAPMSSEPASSEPPLSTPAPSKPAPSKPAPSKLASSTPASSTPAPSKPAMSKPAPSKSASSKPAPFKPTSPKPASSKLDLSTGLVSQIVDGQVQALTSSGSLTGQTSSGQAQGPTSAVHSSPAAVVSQLNDGQVQVPGSISVSVPFTPLPPLAGEALKGPLEASPTIVPAAPPAISSTGSPPAPSATQSPTASPAISVAASSAFPPAAPIVPPAAPSPAETVTETAPAPPATEAPVITETQTAIPPPSPDWNPEYTSSSSSSQGPVGSPPIIVPPGNGGESPSSDAHLDYELKNTVSLFGLVMIAALL